MNLGGVRSLLEEWTHIKVKMGSKDVREPEWYGKRRTFKALKYQPVGSQGYVAIYHDEMFYVIIDYADERTIYDYEYRKSIREVIEIMEKWGYFEEPEWRTEE